MSEYTKIEEYDFSFTNASIQMYEGKYIVYVGGSGISNPYKTLTEARQAIFNAVKMEISYRKTEAYKRINALTVVENVLKNDYFNIGMYKSKTPIDKE